MRHFLLLSLLSFTAFAQNKYTVKGFYSEPGKTTPTPYALNWVESGTEIKGLYKDPSIKESIPMTVVQDGMTRILTINDRNITIITRIPSDSTATSVPVSFTQMDQNKNILAANMLQADFSFMAPQAQEERVVEASTPCREGFGGLAGFCGSYQGMVVEESDTANRCALIKDGNVPRMELNQNGELGVRVAPVSTLNPNPIHVVGRIPLNVNKSSVDIMTRVCRPLDGTSFGGDDCKRINISGDFSSTQANPAHFFGTYVIVDEKTNERCQYRFSLDRG